ncbi:MAG TPA: FIST N-terminal domain-containing protein [Dictyobacter sp.]|jgi:small ligand-binding sensory domain FIST|nr:FIST N-terminal domain-containing protein [Dictyobacter sp.]
MDERKSGAQSAIVVDQQWDQALEQALAQVQDITADVVFVFLSSEYEPHYGEIITRIRKELGNPILLGCSGQGIIGTDQELEDLPSLSLLTLSLPDAVLRPVRLTQQLVETCIHPDEWRQQLGIKQEEIHGWLVFADPFQMDCEGLIEGLATAYPDVPLLGGLASGDIEGRYTHVFLNDDVYDDGGVALAIGGPYTLLPLVSQGCEPIGEPWTITKVMDNGLVEGISNRSAYEMLLRTFDSLNTELQKRAQRNLLVGLAADEYQDSFHRGSFLIRQLLGVDRRTGSLALAALPRVGQTIQFQMRDAVSADLDLRELMQSVKLKLGEKRPLAGILCTCNGRGVGMFGVPDHDAGVIARELGQIPLAGLFCNGEIGPIGKKSFLHGFTACLALFIRQS